MKALVYHGPGLRAWETVPDPTVLDPTDVIVQIGSSTICGTDLHILKGDVPEVKPGTVLGHEAVGTVVQTGAGIATLKEGDRVLVSCITSCGRCRFCREGHYGLCTGGGGWIFGHLIDGLQAEFARVPFADTSVHKVPESLTDEQVLFLADILPTAYEVGILNGRVGPGDTVAIVGAGPIGLAAIMTAKLFTPGRIIAIDIDPGRLAKAREFGADATIDNGREDPVAAVEGADRRSRRRRSDGGGRSPRGLRALHGPDPPGRPRRGRVDETRGDRDVLDPERLQMQRRRTGRGRRRSRHARPA